MGAGKLATALSLALRKAGHEVQIVPGRSGGRVKMKPDQLVREPALATSAALTTLAPQVVWLCVPDSAISDVAKRISRELDWKGRAAFHSSGALAGDELNSLRRRGAAVASVHPLMTFVPGSRPPLAGVPFAIEGDAAAVRAARQIVGDLGGGAFPIRRKDKAAYHAWATLLSPLFTSLLATSERVAALAGVRRSSVRTRAVPILLQTLANYAAFGPAQGFSGPIVRGDADTIERHVGVLRKIPAARNVYRSLAAAALAYLPARNKARIAKALRSSKSQKNQRSGRNRKAIAVH